MKVFLRLLLLWLCLGALWAQDQPPGSDPAANSSSHSYQLDGETFRAPAPQLNSANYNLVLAYGSNQECSSATYRMTGSTMRFTPLLTINPTATPVCSQPGDVNCDETITIIDALMTAQYAVGLVPVGFIQATADVNSDGTIDILDALMIAQYYVGMITAFPPVKTGTV